MSSIRPLQDRVVVRRLDSETTTAGGIVLPDSAADKPNQGEVVSVGPGVRLDNGETQAVAVKPGDCILFGKYSPNEITVDGEELLIIKEADILAVIENASLEKAA
ncbi:MAG: co-chaperone GroES [Pseudomonadales bacterium]|nr:co-chaperone GroES [Pseudomonadales bacterium]